jgi:sigma-E factor negative regulatory protein RseC
MKSKIRHAGVIDSIEHSHVRVKIVQAAACAGCKVASHCNASEAKEKIIDVYTDVEGLVVGQEVTVSTSNATAGRAIFLGFVIPLIIMTGVLIVLKMLNYDDGITALWAIGSLIPYYFLLWILRDRISRQVSFELEES